MFSVVTISRQIGSGGSRFAQALAARCGYQLVWREVINKAAIQIGSPDVALAMIDELGLLGLCPDPEVCQAYINAVSTVMNDYANQGKIIIVGRASQVVLKNNPQVFHIRVIADLETRVKNICKNKKVHSEAARQQINQSDTYRQDYLKKFYQVDWNDAALYDLVLNTAKIPMTQLVNMVSTLIKDNSSEKIE